MNSLKYVLVFLSICSATISDAQTISERLQNLGNKLSNAPSQQFLHPDEAFVLSVSPVSPVLLNVSVVIAEGYYLYHDKFSFEFIEGEARINSDTIVIPRGKIKEDPSFGQVEVNII